MMLRRAVWITAPAVLVAVSLVAVVAALAYGGGADSPLAKDPGAVLARKESPGRNLHCYARFGQRGSRVPQEDLAIGLVNGFSCPLPIDERRSRQP